MFRPNRLKRSLAAGGHVLGCWTMLGSPLALQLLGHAGFDYLLIDQEHGYGDTATLFGQLQAVCNTPATSVVRVPWNDPVTLKRVLDAGAEGVMIPSVDSAEEARAAVAACRYPPKGRRGTAASSVRASSWGMAPDYVAKAADELLIVCQIETVKGVENVDAIAAVDGVDVVFIGPYDLSGSAGRLGELEHPHVTKLLDRAEARILASGKPMGTVPNRGMGWRELFGRGYRFVNAGSDVAKLRDSSLADVKAFRQAYPGS